MPWIKKQPIGVHLYIFQVREKDKNFELLLIEITQLDMILNLANDLLILIDRRIDMLPTLLSGNLCSLRGGVERFAFSCIWEVNPITADFVTTKFCKSIIKSKKAMTYEEAQNRIDDEKDQSELTLSLRRLMKLSKILKSNRRKLGALQLAGSEVRFTVDRETADPIDVQTKKVILLLVVLLRPLLPSLQGEDYL